MRLTFQSVVEEIVCEELGRDRYQRRREDSPEGYRNGWHQPRTLKTAAGPVPLQRPKLRHAHAALCDQLFGAGVTRTNALETLVISCWVRGLSDRDVEAMLVEVFGQDATISRTTVSRICQRLRALTLPPFRKISAASARRTMSTFRLQHGHVHALIGPNGAGKSTMINMISGVLTPSSGRIAFLGSEIGGLGESRDLSPWHRPNVSEPTPVRGPFGPRERLAWAALPHEERLLGLVTGATTSSPGRGGSERTCNLNSRHPWSS